MRELLPEHRKLVVARKIDAAIRCQHACEDTQMRRNPFRQQRVCPRCKVDLAALCMLLPEIFEQRLIVGQMHHINRGQRRDLALERRLPFGNPLWELQHRPWTLPRQHDQRIHQRVGLDQRSVQIHTQWHFRRSLPRGKRAGLNLR
jgi:hypothetical protein